MGKKNREAAPVVEEQVVAAADVGDVADVLGAPTEDEQHRYPPIDNSGKLFLRLFFKNPEKGDKTITKLRGKVYFPRNPNIEPGWYVTTITDEQKNWGIMDTMALDAVPSEMWDPKIILGIYIKKNFDKGVKEVYRAIPKDKLETDESPLIWTVPMNETQVSAGATIAEIIASKREQMVDSL